MPRKGINFVREVVKKDLDDSAYDFTRVVWPAISKWFKKGKLIRVEDNPENDFLQVLDAYSGIDYWNISYQDEVIQTIASRVQWGKRYDSFTIRYERKSGAITEYEKRIKAITTNTCLYPNFTVQAYITERRVGKLLSVGAVKTINLFTFLSKQDEYYIQTHLFTNPTDGNLFIAVFWSELLKNKIKVPHLVL